MYTDGSRSVRFRLGPVGQLRVRVVTDEQEARLHKIAATLVRAGRASEGRVILPKAAAASPEDLAKIEQWVAKRPARSKAKGGPVTFQQLAERWVSGKLAEKHPDHVKLKKSVRDDRYRLAKLYETIGDVPLESFAIDDAERAMAALPTELEASSRRQYAQLISKVLKLAAFPCRIISQSPLPAGFLPKPRNGKAKGWLYPSEDALLLRSPAAPWRLRLLWGLLAREGLRIGEARALTWADLDLKRGTLRLDENKSDTPRTWALRPDVVRSLGAFKATVKALQALPDDLLVFEGLVCGQEPERARLLGELLAGEGLRIEDAQTLRWSDVDTKRGTLRLGARVFNPSKDAMQSLRTFKDVGKALRELSDGPDARVFEGLVLDGSASERLREHLQLAGVDRRELFTETSKRQPLRVHDLRATFVTLALAAGKSEAWVADRTGHKSSQMIAKYRRSARLATELHLGELGALDELLGLGTPETRNETGKGKAMQVSDSIVGRPGFEPGTYGLKEPASCSILLAGAAQDTETVSLQYPQTNTDQQRSSAFLSRPETEHVEAALAEALRAATAAGQWGVVAELAAELKARRENGGRS